METKGAEQTKCVCSAFHPIPDDHHFHVDNDNGDNGFDDNINDDNDNGGDGENDCTDENLKKAGRHSPLLA